MDIARLINRPAADWSLADLETIAQASLPESLTLEFKADFSRAMEERWRTHQDQISRQSRDALAAEIVAFANAFGGTLLLGVKEEKNGEGLKVSAGLSNPIPAIAQCAERLEAALHSMIDPPLSTMEIKGIAAPDSGAGYIVIKVPQSLSAPHGFGEPPAAYVRRGASSYPMSMREMQSVFWEARTAVDRVNNTFNSRREEFKRELVGLQYRVPLSPHVLYRFTVVPGRHFQIPHLPSLVVKRAFQAAGVPFLRDQVTKFTFAAPVWQPAAGGAVALEARDQEHKEVRVWSDGTWNLRGRHVVANDRQFPGWYAVGALWLLYNAMRLRRRLGRVDVPLYMEGEIATSDDRQVLFGGPFGGDFQSLPEPGVTDRLELGRDREFDDVAQLFAEQVGWACGIDMDFTNLRLGPNLNLNL